ncbi:hypothetical protein LZ31DRAFT_107971 [Colletotrichum somersetense]|nr:hypothetical protein LZ31DRAFT_107971 [Colletotrichum somersetense]
MTNRNRREDSPLLLQCDNGTLISASGAASSDVCFSRPFLPRLTGELDSVERRVKVDDLRQSIIRILPEGDYPADTVQDREAASRSGRTLGFRNTVSQTCDPWRQPGDAGVPEPGWKRSALILPAVLLNIHGVESWPSVDAEAEMETDTHHLNSE